MVSFLFLPVIFNNGNRSASEVGHRKGERSSSQFYSTLSLSMCMKIWSLSNGMYCFCCCLPAHAIFFFSVCVCVCYYYSFQNLIKLRSLVIEGNWAWFDCSIIVFHCSLRPTTACLIYSFYSWFWYKHICCFKSVFPINQVFLLVRMFMPINKARRGLT